MQPILFTFKLHHCSYCKRILTYLSIKTVNVEMQYCAFVIFYIIIYGFRLIGWCKIIHALFTIEIGLGWIKLIFRLPNILFTYVIQLFWFFSVRKTLVSYTLCCCLSATASVAGFNREYGLLHHNIDGYIKSWLGYICSMARFQTLLQIRSLVLST